MRSQVDRFTRGNPADAFSGCAGSFDQHPLLSGSPAGEIAVSQDAPGVKTNVIRIEVCRLGQRKTRKRLCVSLEGSPECGGAQSSHNPEVFCG